MNSIITCPYCHSTDISKYGTFEGIQRYWCKKCRRKFTEVDNLPKMKTPMKVIASALSCYYGGMPLDAIQRHLQQEHGLYLAESTIYDWVIRFSREAVERARSFRPVVGSTWIADETMINVGGRKVWFWDIIDSKTRYLLASHISTTRTINDAAELMHKAAQAAGKPPKRVITDRLAAYLDGIELTFGADAKHIQSKPFTIVDSTNLIERFHGTLKQRTKVIKRFSNMETAKLLTDTWLVHYNFFKEHESVGNISPAQTMGIKTPFEDWNDILGQVRADMLAPAKAEKPEPRRPIVHSYARPTVSETQRVKPKSKPKAKKKLTKKPIHPTVIATRVR